LTDGWAYLLCGHAFGSWLFHARGVSFPTSRGFTSCPKFLSLLLSVNTMPLRKRLKNPVGTNATKSEGKKSKRQKILAFFRHRKHKPEAGNDAVQV
jgi:hypothetical protein